MNKDLLTSPADLEVFKKTTLDAFGSGLGHLPGMDKLIVKEYPCVLVWVVAEGELEYDRMNYFSFHTIYLNDFTYEETTT